MRKSTTLLVVLAVICTCSPVSAKLITETWTGKITNITYENWNYGWSLTEGDEYQWKANYDDEDPDYTTQSAETFSTVEDIPGLLDVADATFDFGDDINAAIDSLGLDYLFRFDSNRGHMTNAGLNLLLLTLDIIDADGTDIQSSGENKVSIMSTYNLEPGSFSFAEFDILTDDGHLRFAVYDISVNSTSSEPVPEPATLTLMGLGLACLVSLRKKAIGR